MAQANKLVYQYPYIDQMLAASEAKQKLKDLKQEQEDMDRLERMNK
jgi:hypothetical protein